MLAFVEESVLLKQNQHIIGGKSVYYDEFATDRSEDKGPFSNSHKVCMWANGKLGNK